MQHKKLVAMLNELYEAMSGGAASGPVLKKSIDELLTYTKTHFSYEEQLMKKSGYPEFEEHVQKHHAMVKRVQEFAKKLNQDASQPVLEFASFLKDWLQKHNPGHRQTVWPGSQEQRGCVRPTCQTEVVHLQKTRW